MAVSHTYNSRRQSAISSQQEKLTAVSYTYNSRRQPTIIVKSTITWTLLL